MVTVKIADKTIPAEAFGCVRDPKWDYRSTVTLNCRVPFDEAKADFKPKTPWGYIWEDGVDTEGNPIQRVEDKSDFCVVCSIAENMDGTVSITMGKMTDGEMLAELKEAMSNGV